MCFSQRFLLLHLYEEERHKSYAVAAMLLNIRSADACGVKRLILYLQDRRMKMVKSSLYL